STPHNDSAEAAAVAKVFGPGAVPVTSNKGAIGHLIGAAGAVEAIAALLAADRGVVPPTANHDGTDLPVDVVAGEPREIGRAPAVSTSFALGRHNVALVPKPLRRPRPRPPPCRTRRSAGDGPAASWPGSASRRGCRPTPRSPGSAATRRWPTTPTPRGSPAPCAAGSTPACRSSASSARPGAPRRPGSTRCAAGGRSPGS